MTTNLETKKIVSLSINIEGMTFYYEAHSMHKVAEILASQIETLKTSRTDEYGNPIYSQRIENFQIHYEL